MPWGGVRGFEKHIANYIKINFKKNSRNRKTGTEIVILADNKGIKELLE